MAPHGNVIILILSLCTTCLQCAARSYEPRRSASSDNHASAIEDVPMHGPRVDNQELPQDLGKPYPGKSFGPMGPVDRTFPDISLRNLENGGDNIDNIATKAASGVGITEKKLREYQVFNVEFHRVETPFVIGIWIFFASLAKIGK